MSCGRRDVGCGEASCVEKWQDEELLVSSRRSIQAPILNPMREIIMWGSTKQQTIRITTTQQSGQISCSSCTSIAEYCQDRWTSSKRIRTRKATKIKRVALLPLLLAYLCQCTTSSSISPMLYHNGGCHSKAERRKNKNNTAFYYGIREEHISCSSSTSLRTLSSSLRPPLSSWKPAVQGLTSKLQSVPYHISLLARERAEWVQDVQKRNTQILKNSLSHEEVDASVGNYPSSQCKHGQQQQQQVNFSRKKPFKRLHTIDRKSVV